MANRCLNKVILIGNLTRDPELRYTPEGTPVCTFGLATNRSWTTSDGQKKEEVQYHRIVAWHKLAELCAKILTKGKKIYIEGRLTYRTFTGKDNQEKSIAEIVLDDFISFDNRKKDSTIEEATTEENKSETNKDSNNISLTNESQEKKEENQNSTDENINPDDIPF